MRTAGVVVALLWSSAVLAAPAKPKVNVGIPKLTGGTDTKGVGTTLRAAGNKLGDCYAKALKTNPELKTTATVTFTISTEGKAVAASAIGLDQTAEACITGVVGTLAFAKSKDPVEVNVAIAFELPKAGAEGDGAVDGGFGYGTSGFGPGGGCGGTGWGTIGTGRYGTIGHGSGYGVGGGGCGGGMRSRTSAVPTISIGQPTVTGDLDKAIVRRYIKRNIQKLQYCYEKQLLAKPKLAGTINAEFTIAANGLVSASGAKGVDKDVESCFSGVIKGIEFPKPKNGSAVKVAYPFTLRPSGG